MGQKSKYEYTNNRHNAFLKIKRKIPLLIYIFKGVNKVI